jgi:transposase
LALICFQALNMTNATSVRQRVNIVLLSAKGSSERAIAKELSTSRGAIRHWFAEWNSGGSMEEKRKPGRPSVLSGAAKKLTRRLLKQPGFGGPDHAAHILHLKAATPTVLHRSTLSRMLRERPMGVPSRLVPDRRAPAYALTAVDMHRCLAFARANLHRDWSTVMFTDRKRFCFKYPGSKVAAVQWHEQGEKREVFKPTNPQCVNVYMGITRFGTTGGIEVAGTSKHKSPFSTKAGKPARNITAQEYGQVLKKHLLPKGQACLGGGGGTVWWFQQDNDPADRGAQHVITEFNKETKSLCNLLPNWPPHSPDLSPIENIWAIVQAKVNAKGYKTFDKFPAGVMLALESVDTAGLEALYARMRKRLEDTIACGGGKVKH